MSEFPNVFSPYLGASTRCFMAMATGSDLDNAWDTASRAGQDCAPDSPLAWLAQASAGDVEAVQDTPISPDAALAWALAALNANAVLPGQTLAMPVSAAGAWTRTKTRVVLEDSEIALPDAPYTLLRTDEQYAQAWTALAAMSSGEEDIQRIEIQAVRRRFRPVATANRTASAASFAIIEGDQILERGHKTAGDAKRSAIAMLKGLDATSATQPQLDIVKIAGRIDGPFIEVRRTLLTQKAKAVIISASAKPAAGKVSGWLLLGQVARPQ